MRSAQVGLLLHRALEINAKNVMKIARSAMEEPIIVLHATRSKFYHGLIIHAWILAPKA
jgi:hypothetical protein